MKSFSLRVNVLVHGQMRVSIDLFNKSCVMRPEDF